MKWKKALVISIIACMGAGLLTACNSNKKEEGSGFSSAYEGASDKNGQFMLVTDKEFLPFEFKDENGDLTGFDIDLLTAIAKDQKFVFEIVAVGWEAAIAASQDGTANGMIAGASITDERKSAGWIFSDGYYKATQCMFTKEKSNVKGFEDIKKKKVGACSKTLGAKYAEGLKEEYGFTIKYYDNNAELYEGVLANEVDAGFGDTPSVSFAVLTQKLKLKVLTDTENEGFSYGLAIHNPENQQLIDLFNAGLANIKENGVYDKIVEKYFGKAETKPETTQEETAGPPTEESSEATAEG